MRKSLLGLVGVVAVGAMVLAGCSSGSSGASGSSAVTTGSATTGSAAAGGAASSSQPAGSSASPAAQNSSGGASSAAPSSGAQSAVASSSAPASASAAGTAPASGQSLTDKSFVIGIDFPDNSSPRYATKDLPYFQAALKKYCPNCKLLHADADNDETTQQNQTQSMLAQGANVLVVDPPDGIAAASVVQAAKADKVPVVAYDRAISSPDLSFVASFDYTKVGQLQAQTLVAALKARGVPTSSGGIVMVNGSATDPNASSMRKGSIPVIKASGYKILASHDTWVAAEAQQWVSSQITRFGTKIDAIYTGNDSDAQGALAAMKAAGWSDQRIGEMSLTGLDATIGGLQNIVAGLQMETTYNPYLLEADSAAKAAVQLALGQKPTGNGTINGIPAELNPPTAVTIKNIQSTVIKDGFWKASEICTTQYQADCAKAGIH